MISLIPVEFNPFAEVKEIEKITLTNEPQREIWLSCVIGGNDANLSYNESVSLKINGALNFAAFKKAVDNLVLRHEALRSTISPNGETLIIYNDLPLTLELQDISGPDSQNKFNSFLRIEMNTPLDLVEGPLLKVFLHKTGLNEHYATIVKHHIIGDGWSTGVILEDLSRMYNAYSKGEDVLLDTPAQISDYGSAQQAFKLTGAYKDTEDYWLSLYKDKVPVLDIPTDRPRVSPRTYKGNRIDYPISKEMTDQLKTVGARQGCSLVTTLLSAFEIFLYQQTRQQDIVVGMPASGQAATGLVDVIGHCVNLLPLRSHIDSAMPFSAYLKTRRKEVLDAYDHQRLTFGELIKKLYIQRDPSRIPLVPVLFNIDMGMDNAVSFDGLDYTLISNPRSYENFEIFLNATGSKEGIVLEWSYNTGLFDETTIKEFNSSYDTLLREVIANPDILISDLAGEQAVPDLVPDNVLLIDPGKNIVTMLADAAKKYAGNAAVTFKNTTFTYSQLAEKTDQFSSLLIQQGIGAGDIVAISLERSMEMLVCLLGVLKSGAAYVPLDPRYPFERTSFMLEDSSAKLLITSKDFKGRYSGTNELVTDEIWPTLTSYKKQAPKRKIEWTDLTYLLYTSGSTGKPKGVRITHGNMVNFLLSMQHQPGISESDRLLAITSISFDIACLELYLPLTSGACLVIADTQARKDGRLILDLIEKEKITVLQGTPSTWQMLLDSGWEKHYQLRMFTGGEQLTKDLADKLLERGAELWNMYAPTETTIYSTVKQITKQDKQITIGYPIYNTRVYILNERLERVSFGQPDQIYIGGAGVADGYWSRPELTAERFITDPFSAVPGAKLYRTGDLGIMLPDGEIVCLGRIDNQVKIRGHRIELGEIESALMQLEGVKQAVVIANEVAAMDKRLIAYVTLKDRSGDADSQSWKDRWDTLYETGAENKEKQDNDKATIDGTLLESLENSQELSMQRTEWLQTTVARIKELNAKRIYEIGSGAGQVLFELAPGINYYMATDYAPAAITNINKRLAAEPEKWKHVKAAVAAAEDFSAVTNTPLDLVVLNSVAQYFPDAEYMINVIRQGLNALKQNGCFFIGDMQGMNSLEMYHAMDHLPRAAAGTTLRQFRDVVANRVRIEEEFVADPAFFYLLPKLIPRITGVDVQLRRGQSINETTKYHYDIWLYTTTPIEIVQPQIRKNWDDIQTTEALEAILESNNGEVVEVKNILNSRTARDHKLLKLLHTGDEALKLTDIRSMVEQAPPGIHPDVLWQLGDKLNYKTHIRWTTDGTDGMFDAVFIPASQTLRLPPYTITTDFQKNIFDFARTPVLNNEVRIPAELPEKWRRGLTAVLPAHMVPEDFIALKKFPLTPNAKTDRNALPKPQPRKVLAREKRRMLTPNEQIITDIWYEVLGLQDVRPDDNFFQLGGHSLLAVKVMVAIEKKTGKRLPIATLFNNSTIERLALQLSDEKKEDNWDAVVPIKTTGNKAPLFLIHGAGLNILLFKSISEYFDADQPVYGIQALGLSRETDIPSTIQDIAAHYIKEILQVVPSGQCALAGYSMGGFIAYDMARQLKAMGKEVQFLAVMDTYAGNNQEIENKVTHIANKIKRQFRKVPFFTKSFISDPGEALKYQVVVVKKRLTKLTSPGIIIPKDTFTDYEAEVLRTYDRALAKYTLAPLDVKMILFRVKKRLYFLDDLVTLGWDKFALKGVTVHEVPGDHKTFLFPPNSEQFAHIMQSALDAETIS